MKDNIDGMKPKGALHSEKNSVESRKNSNKERWKSGNEKLKFKVVIKYDSDSGNLASFDGYVTMEMVILS